MSAVIELWVVYDHPVDAPAHYVARRWLVSAGVVTATSTEIWSPDVEVIRTALYDKGLVQVDRSPGDDPVIMESWV